MSYLGVKYHCCAHDCRYEFRETVNPPGCTYGQAKAYRSARRLSLS